MLPALILQDHYGLYTELEFPSHSTNTEKVKAITISCFSKSYSGDSTGLVIQSKQSVQ